MKIRDRRRETNFNKLWNYILRCTGVTGTNTRHPAERAITRGIKSSPVSGTRFSAASAPSLPFPPTLPHFFPPFFRSSRPNSAPLDAEGLFILALSLGRFSIPAWISSEGEKKKKKKGVAFVYAMMLRYAMLAEGRKEGKRKEGRSGRREEEERGANEVAGVCGLGVKVRLRRW